MIIRIKKHIGIILVIIAAITLVSMIVIDKYNQSIMASTKPSIKLPIIMYHQILKDPGTWGKYVISPDDFEEDLKYIAEKGYTTIDVQDLIDYAYFEKELPPKPIMITLDDGYLTVKEYVLPILKKYNAKAVVSIVGKFTDRFTDNEDTRLSYAHLSWNDIKNMVDSEYVEIQNHSYDMHNNGKRKGAAKIRGESSEDYRKALNNDILYMQTLTEKNAEYTPTAFTYPFGEISKEADPILRDMGFLATLTCTEGINLLTGDSEELYNLKRYNRPYNINREKFFSKLEKAI